jgi:DNA repair protein RadA/Sms
MCNEFDTMVEEIERPKSAMARPHFGDERPVPITEVKAVDRPRIEVGIAELDRVLGGGVVIGSVNLIGGDPGIGKSTVLLQLCREVAGRGQKVLYISSEESVQQTKLRADRLGVDSPNLFLVSETNVEIARRHIESVEPAIAIMDSIQMVYKPEIPSAPGSVGQVRECAADLSFFCKRRGISLFFVGHVTKEGAIAGPRTLEHLVDGVFYFEGDRFQSFRVLRGVKNRFGSTNEIGIFEMQTEGLVEVSNPSDLFMSEDRKGRVGSVVASCIIGSRTLLVEIQSLTMRSSGGGYPARRTTGIDQKRLSILIAVLTQRCGLDLSWEEVFANAVGGVQIDEPAVDLAVAGAIASAFRDRPIDERVCMIGEVGLAGEVRGVAQAGARVMEAARLGFKRVILPRDNAKALDKPDGVDVVAVKHLADALEAAGVL